MGPYPNNINYFIYEADHDSGVTRGYGLQKRVPKMSGAVHLSHDLVVSFCRYHKDIILGRIQNKELGKVPPTSLPKGEPCARMLARTLQPADLGRLSPIDRHS